MPCPTKIKRGPFPIRFAEFKHRPETVSPFDIYGAERAHVRDSMRSKPFRSCEKSSYPYFETMKGIRMCPSNNPFREFREKTSDSHNLRREGRVYVYKFVCLRIQIWRVLHVRMFGLSNSTLGFVAVLTRGDQQQWGGVYAKEIRSADVFWVLRCVMKVH